MTGILCHIDIHLNMMALARVGFTVLRATADVLVLRNSSAKQIVINSRTMY